MTTDLACERHATAIRVAWATVRQRHPEAAALRPGRAAVDSSTKSFPYDYLLDQAWFESIDGATCPFAGITLWSFAESEAACAAFRRRPGQPPGPTNRVIPRPVGLFDGGDVLALATIGRSNVIGKMLRISPAAIDLIRAGDPSRPCEIALAIGKASTWIAATFRG